MRLRRALFFAVGLTGCGASVYLPAPFADATSVVLIVSSIEGPIAEGIAGGDFKSARFADVTEDGTILALAYDLGLEDLQLGPGAIPLMAEDALAGRPFPMPDRLMSAAPGSATWTPAEVAALARFRVAEFEPLRCLDLGRCVADRPSCVPCPPKIALAAPSPPTLPCPATWVRHENAGELVSCAPESPALVDCPGSQRQPVHEAGCVPIGACAMGQWPATRIPGAPRLYVSQGAIGGDGSLAMPFATIGAAAAAATPGTEIAIAPGRYLEEIETNAQGVRFVGACPDTTTWVAPIDVALLVTGSVAVDSIHFEGASPIEVGPFATLSIRGAHLGGGTGTAILVEGELDVWDTRVDSYEEGIYGLGGSRINVRDAQLSGSARAQLSGEGTVIDARRTRFIGDARRTNCDSSGVRGILGTQIELVDSILERACRTNLALYDPGTRAHVRDVLIRDSNPKPEYGFGVVVFGHSEANLERVAIMRAAKCGLHVDLSTLVATDLLIAETQSSDLYTSGLRARYSSVTIERMFLDRNLAADLDVGIDDGGAPADVRITDWTVRALANTRGPHAAAEHLTLIRGAYQGVGRLELDAATDGELSDFDLNGGGLAAAHNPGVVIRRVAITDAVGYGLNVLPQSCGLGVCQPMGIEDLLIRGVQPNLRDESIGAFLNTVLPIRLERFEISGASHGVDLVEPKTVTLIQGQITETDVGLTTSAFPTPPSLFFGSLQFEGNGQNVQLTGP